MRIGKLWSLRPIRASGLTFIAAIVAQGSTMIGLILIARTIGESALGVVTMVKNTMLTIGMVVGSGLSLAAIRNIGLYLKTSPEIAGRSIRTVESIGILIATIATFLTVLQSGLISETIFGDVAISLAIKIGGLLLPSIMLGTIYVGILTGFECFGLVAKISVVEALLNLAAIITGCLWQAPEAILGSLVAAGVVSTGVKWYAVQRACAARGLPLEKSLSFRGAGIVTFAIPAVLTTATGQPLEWIARVMLANEHNGLRDIGVFSVVYSWAQLIVMIPGYIVNPNIAHISNLIASGDKLNAVRVTRQLQMACVLAALVLVLGFTTIGRSLLAIYGVGFTDGYSGLLVISCAYLIGSGTVATRAIMVASGMMWVQLLHTAGRGVILCGLFYFFNPRTVLKLAISYLAAYAAFAAIQLIYHRRLEGSFEKSYLLGSGSSK